MLSHTELPQKAGSFAPNATIDRIHGYSVKGVDAQKINSYSPSAKQVASQNRTLTQNVVAGANAVYTVSIRDLFDSVKMGSYVQNLVQPQIVTDGSGEYLSFDLDDTSFADARE